MLLNTTKYDFKLTNQNGKEITQANYKDKIYVADFSLQHVHMSCNDQEYVPTTRKDKTIIKFYFYLTLWFRSWHVEQLKKYAIENNVDDSKWNLVTVDKKQIYDLARKSYLAVEDSNYNEYDMIHTENFMLIDKEKQIRGFYDGTNSEDINRLLKDIEILKQSYTK